MYTDTSLCVLLSEYCGILCMSALLNSRLFYDYRNCGSTSQANHNNFPDFFPTNVKLPDFSRPVATLWRRMYNRVDKTSNVPDVGVTEQVPLVGGQEATKTYSADPMSDLNVFA